MTRIEAPTLDESLADLLPDSPLPILGRWLEEARLSERIRNPDAMALATVDATGSPQVRMVLCRGFDVESGRFAFYTNRASPKAKDLDRNGRASGVFYWDALARQARIAGPVERASDMDSDRYFAGRHPHSQIAAWASMQSETIASRAVLMERFEAMAERLGGLESTNPIERPPYWGGYVVTADRVELWVERPGRLHDRVLWTRELADSTGQDGVTAPRPPTAVWQPRRLQP